MSLKLDWCSDQAARHAVMNWHYSKRMPVGKMVRVGVWEHDKFIGCVLFARGASNKLGDAFGLDQTEVCELVRVALTKHDAPVSRIGAIAMKLLKKHCPSMKLIISYADDREGHHGGIYQAMNWIYVGRTPPGKEWFHQGRWKHNREMSAGAFGNKQKVTNYTDLPKRITPGKHKYIYVLDESLRPAVQSRSVPYPKRPRAASVDSDAPCTQHGEGGANPTAALSNLEVCNGKAN